MPSTETDVLDGISTSTAVKSPCRLATTANITLSGLQTIDGSLTVAGDRVLVKNQTSSAENGIYYAHASAWERCPDWDGARDARNGTLVIVNAGSGYSNTLWKATGTDPIDIGTSSVTFGLEVFGGGSASTLVANIASLRAATTVTLTASSVNLVGYYTSSVIGTPDGGGGIFTYDSTDVVTADNGRNVIVDASGRRWKRAEAYLTPQQSGNASVDATSFGFGTEVLIAETTGQRNSGGGYRVLKANTSGSENTGFGYLVLTSVIGGVDPAGNYNTGIGSFVLAALTTGYKNTAGGRACMDNLTTGFHNSGWGYGAMHQAITSFNSSAFGFETLHEGEADQGNSGFGFHVLYACKGGEFNTMGGVSAGASITTGDRNSGWGVNALNGLVTGSDNSALGYAAGITHTGSGSIFIGQNADANAGLSNVTVIGTGITATASNLMLLGNGQTILPGTNNEDFGSQSFNNWGYGIFNKAVYAWQGTAIPAGGTAGSGFVFSSTANFGVFFGSGAPTLSAAKGSLYLRSDGTTTNNRAYINTDSSTTWTALTTAA